MSKRRSSYQHQPDSGPGDDATTTRRRPPQRRYSPGWRLATVLLLRPMLRAVIRHESSGRDRVPSEGGVILAANHLSYADWPTVGLFSYDAGRFPVFLIKSSIFDVAGIGGYLRRLGELPVRRGSNDAALVLNDAERALREGDCVIFYPEGTATRDPDHWPMRGKTGVARLALSTGVPVVPVAHWGAQDVLPYGSFRPRLLPRKTVRLAAGPPVDLSRYSGRPLTSATLRAATADIMAAITALLGDLRGETPPAVAYDPTAKREVGAAARRGGADLPPPVAGEPAGRTVGGASPDAGDGTVGPGDDGAPAVGGGTPPVN